MNKPDLFLTALDEIEGKIFGEHALSRILPDLLQKNDIQAINKLFGAFRLNCERWDTNNPFPYLVELLTLLNVQNVSHELICDWTAALSGNGKNDDLAYSFGRIGVLGFSFPIWRFLAQRLRNVDGTTNPALLELAGMQRLTRDSDTFIDQSGQKNDWFGIGFVKEFQNGEVEYRRAYLRISLPEHGHLIIRNSSYFWGRDRLQHEAYADLDEKSLLPITARELWNGSPDNIKKNVSNLHALVECLVAFEEKLSNWIFPGSGLHFLVNNLSERLKDLSKKIPILGFINPNLPPWLPYTSLRISEGVLADIYQFAGAASLDRKENIRSSVLNFFQTGMDRKAKLVLLSGEKGDLPISYKSG